MTIISGALNVLLPDATDWQVYEAGSVFNVPVTASFICKLPNPPLICAAICNSSPSP